MQLPKRTIIILLYLAIAAKLAMQIIDSSLGFVWQLWTPVMLWLLGGLLGYLTLNIDRIIDIYVGNPESKLALYVKQYVSEKHYLRAWQLIMHNQKLQRRLTFRSALFQVIWVLLAIFTITSTASWFGNGYVLGLGLHLLVSEWQDYLTDKNYLKNWLFWQINHQVTDNELKIYMVFMTMITLLMFVKIVF